VPVGIIHLPITIGPITLMTPCFVINKDFSYNLLLGRPWIHCMCVVPSTLYQYVKLNYQGKIYVIPRDPDPLAYYQASAPLNCYRPSHKVITSLNIENYNLNH